VKALLLTYWISPGGFELHGGKPDISEVEIPDGDWHVGDRFDLEDGRKAFVEGRRTGVVVLLARKVHEPMEVKA
jgi:hypothetical protein